MNNPARILIVDDNAANREILVKRLQPQGYEFLQAADGEEALAIATRSIVSRRRHRQLGDPI